MHSVEPVRERERVEDRSRLCYCSVTTTVTQLYSRPEWVVSMRAMAGLLAHGGQAMALVPTQGAAVVGCRVIVFLASLFSFWAFACFRARFVSVGERGEPLTSPVVRRA